MTCKNEVSVVKDREQEQVGKSFDADMAAVIAVAVVAEQEARFMSDGQAATTGRIDIRR